MSISHFIKEQLPYWPNWLNWIFLRLNVLGKWAYGKAYVSFCHQIDDVSPEEELIKMVNLAIKTVPYYKQKYGNLHISCLKEFEEKIGLIDKEEVMAHWEDFIVEGIDWKKVFINTTGGTSGCPLKLVTPKNRYVINYAFHNRALERYGWHYNTKAVFRNSHLPQSRTYIINPLMKEVVFDSFRMDATYAHRCWKVMKRHHIKYINAYPSACYQFLKMCYNQHLELSFIKLAILSSEGVTEAQRNFIEEQLNIPIYSFYGHSERLIRADSMTKSSGFMIEEKFGYCELVTDDGSVINTIGQKGNMVGTTFVNPYFPLIRYKTGDYASFSSLKDGERILCDIVGRWDKTQIYKIDGTSTSATAMNLHSELYEHIDGLQYVQEKKGFIKILIIKNHLFTEFDETNIKEHIGQAMNGTEFVQIEYVDKLIIQENGKFLPLIQHITSEEL